MAFPIPPVAPLRTNPITPGSAPETIRPASSPTIESTEVGGRFAEAVNAALDTISGLENNVDRAGRLAATGDLNSVSDYMIATSEAQLATEITVAIRDRAIAAFNDIMTMQI